MKMKRLKAVRLAAILAAAIGLASMLVAPASAVGVSGQWVVVGGPPGGTLTSIAPSPLYEFDSTVFVSSRSAGVFRSSDRGGSFHRLNNGLTNIAVNEIGLSPEIWIDGTIFAGTTSGVFKTTDSGLNWSAAGAGIVTGDVKGIALSAQFDQDRTVYAAVYGRGVYRSENAGATWTTPGLAGMGDRAVEGVSVSPGDPDELFAWTRTKVFRSVNAGQSWEKATAGLPPGASTEFLSVNFAPDYRNSKTLLLATAYGGIFKSTDSGTEWVSTGLTESGRIQGVVFSPNYGNDGKAFASTGSGGVFKSTDYGLNWTEVNKGLTGLNFGAIAISHAFLNDGTLFTASDTGFLYKTTTVGDDWSETGGVGSADIAGIGFSATYGADATLVGATQSGVFRSTDGGVNWTSMTADLPATNFAAFAVSPAYPVDGTVIAILSGAGVYRTFSNGKWWSEQNGGTTSILRAFPRTIAFSPNYANDHLVLIGGGSGAFRSIDGGASWVQSNAGSTYTDVASYGFSPAIAGDAIVFAGTAGGGVFKSTDAGQSWTQSSTGLTNGMINAVAVSPSFATDRTVLVATAAGIFKSTDGGATWAGVQAGNFMGVALSPDFGSDRFAFAISRGPGGMAFGSSDGGETWSELGAGLGSGMPTTIAVSPNYSQDRNVFVGTSNYGLWVFQGTP